MLLKRISYLHSHTVLLATILGIFFLMSYGSEALCQTYAAGEIKTRSTGNAMLSFEGTEITQIDPGDLSCNGTITFDDVAGGAGAGTNYDEIFESNGAKFSERFWGQTLTFLGDFDVLSGLPTGPLALQVGLPFHNLAIGDHAGTGSNALSGVGPIPFPNYSGICEGSFAVLFDYDQSEFGFDLLGGGGGSATINFFRRDGSLIESVVVLNLASLSYGFRRVGGINDIAGISIHNDDPGGITLDNLCHDVEGVPGDVPVCDMGGPYTGSSGEPILFDGSGSYDPDGSIVSYEWDFGDGNTGNGVTLTHTYAVNGSYTVILCVTDNDGYRTCCGDVEGVVPTDQMSWDALKATYR